MVAKAPSIGQYRSLPNPDRWHLVRKVFLLLLLVVAATLGMTLLKERYDKLPIIPFNLLADGIIGFLMGFGSRLVLRQRHWLIRAVVSASLAIVGLVLLGYLTDNTSGIGPFALQMVPVNWLDQAGIPLEIPILPGRSTTDLLDVSNLVIAVDLSWISQRAWHKVDHSPEIRPGGKRRLTTSGVSGRSPKPAKPLSSMKASQYGVPRVSGPSVRRGSSRRSVLLGSAALRPGRARARSRSLLRHKPGVRLSTHEEHRCPYCLEDVQGDNARGSVECRVCHTLHHKDCWDITGTCQVPHQNG